MDNQNLIDFVEQKRKLGTNDDNIKAELIHAGWNVESVDKILNPTVPKLKNKKYLLIFGSIFVASLFLFFLLSFVFNNDNSGSSDQIDKNTNIKISSPEELFVDVKEEKDNLELVKKNSATENILDCGKYVNFYSTYDENNKKVVDCFIDKFKTCSPAKVQVTYTMNNRGMIYSFNILEKKDNFCNIKVFADQQDDYPQLQGLEAVCALDMNKFEGSISVKNLVYITDEPDLYNCSGTLIEKQKELIVQ